MNVNDTVTATFPSYDDDDNAIVETITGTIVEADGSWIYVVANDAVGPVDGYDIDVDAPDVTITIVAQTS